MALLTPPHSPSHYALKSTTRAYVSTARLNLQHYLWKDQTGYLLHPDIPLSNTALKIADVGTGTGIWLIDLAKTLHPTTQLDGFDIDIADCPPKEWLPPNVQMHELDIFGGIPQHLVGVYDVIQLRLFQVVVRDNDPVPLLKNVLKMLKPGGYLQWAEYDMTTTKTILADPALSASDLDALPAFTQKLKQQDARFGKQDWIPTLPTTFAQAGMIDVTTSRHAPTTSSLPYQLDVFLLTYEELSYKTLDGMADEQGAKLRKLIEKASDEARQGVAWAMERVIFVGRKAEATVENRGVGKVVNSKVINGRVINGRVMNDTDSVAVRASMTSSRRSKRERLLRVWKRLSLGGGVSGRQNSFSRDTHEG
ncbi:hypothetical protein ABVK25_011264 [Lepraria finkii]|uniref:Methyltransferase domain-containing protein n=1 Tax=Lepraria finkii TaxID=1340010 RepID=A0ABR4AQ71_9LECA